ncbi:cysteine-rich and transmembrane domain-containing protein 1-like isoform X1 [Bolinopsis microptera]|uniref:cysteine-rich and transmembrane domain-containing protein 1-like isoform X1 n=1 Tax=Bolinopsis microptera TaxID=2820187 RepID=UPI003078E21F
MDAPPPPQYAEIMGPPPPQGDYPPQEQPAYPPPQQEIMDAPPPPLYAEIMGPPPPQGDYPPPQQAYPPQFLLQQAQAQQHNVVVQEPRTNLVIAWISCLCCCLIGAAAVSKAYEAKECYERGDFEEGKRAGEEALKWAIGSIITQVVLGSLIGYIHYSVDQANRK